MPLIVARTPPEAPQMVSKKLSERAVWLLADLAFEIISSSISYITLGNRYE